MNRRDFLKLLTTATASLFLPAPKTEHKMLLSQIFEKLGKGVKLSPMEVGEFQEWYRQLSYSQLMVNSVKAVTGDFEIPPVGGAHIGWGDIAGGSFPQALYTSDEITVVTEFPYSTFRDNSCVQWLDQANGTFKFMPQIDIDPRIQDSRVYCILGSAQWGSPCTNTWLWLEILRVADDSVVNTQRLVKDVYSADAGGLDHFFSTSVDLSAFTDKIEDLYFRFKTKATFADARGVGVDATFTRLV